MGVICFLCRKKGRGSLHRIPKNPNIRPAWLAFCKLDETVDDVSNIHICSAHFSLADYIEARARELGNKMILKPGSIPSILKPYSSSTSTIVSNLIDADSRLEVKPEPHRLSDSPLKEELDAEAIQVVSCSTQYEGETTLKRPRFAEPRYVGEIRSPHLATPRLAKISFNLAKRKILQQRRQIRTLQQKNRRLLKRIKKFEELVNHLKNRNVISGNSGESRVVV